MHFHTSTGVADKMRPETHLHRVQGGELDAIVRREPTNKDVRDTPRLEPLTHTGGFEMAVVKKTAVTVNAGVCALGKHFGDAVASQFGGQLCTPGVLHAMHRPQCLRQTVQLDLLEYHSPRVACRETAVICGMPILGGDHNWKCRLQFVGDGNHLVAVWDGQSPARQEVVLNVHKDQRLHGIRINQALPATRRKLYLSLPFGRLGDNRMKAFRSLLGWRFRLVATAFLIASTVGDATAQSAAAKASNAREWTAQQDHRNMLEQLQIRVLRPGPSGRAGAPNEANYDPAKANPFPDLPDALTLKDGRKVTTAEMWWHQRRPEIVEDFEREVIGRIPKNVPPVTWSVITQATDRVVGSIPVNARKLVGHADNSSDPSIDVNIEMTLVTPLDAKRPVPVLMMFGGFGGFPRQADEPEPTNQFRGFGHVTFADPPSTEQLIAAGWGYATISPGSIQADNGAGLTRGIIGLVNQGRPRKPDDWGALRAWAWGAARGLDYLEGDSTVDAKHVGIEGVSRYGKAALVTMAFEPRFAMVLVGSSGEGGAKLHRRHFGEAVENLTGSGEYHWMAGNFLKYGAAEASFGSMNAGDLPVDAHELIALCAPRPTFISYGIPEKGDANWLDQQGSYMATVAAGPVFRLLGARDTGDARDYRVAQMPPVNTGLLDGELAWRQHDGGHEDRSNMKYFIAWANQLMSRTRPTAAAQ